MRRSEVENYIKTRLEEEGLLKHATVTVGFRNLSYTVMGEVKNAGEYAIEKDEVTLLEALGKAGESDNEQCKHDVVEETTMIHQ